MTQLQRSLGAVPATAIVVGAVLGTGVFLKSATMTQGLGTPGLVMVAWALAGGASLIGALVYAELGARFPEAGGEYVFVREAFGDGWAFLYGWSRFWIVSPGSIAAYAVGSATFLSGLWIPGDPWVRGAVALMLIGVFTALNCMSVAFAGGSQTFLTALKAVILAALGAGCLFAPHSAAESMAAAPAAGSIATIGTAVLAALWAYDGWNSLPMVAGEIENPRRNIPLSLIAGMGLVTVLYLVVNYSYFSVLSVADVMQSSSTAYPDNLPVATKAAASFLGPAAVKLLALAFVLSAVGAMNAQILAGARVPYAMARDGLFFRGLSVLTTSTRVPARAVLAQSAIACGLALSGTFDQLTDSVIFASWLFYAISAAALFRFRASGVKASFSVPLYPWLPGIFLLFSGFLVVNAIWTSPWQSLVGLALIGLGLPVFFLFRKRP